MAVNSTPPVQLDPSQDQGHQIAFINQNFQSLANSLNPYVLSDGSNNRLLIGKDSAGNYVVKVSKAGFDAFNAADTNLLFNSGQDVFKIVQTGTITSPAMSITNPGALYSSRDAVSTVAHGLGYIPAVLGYLNNSGVYFPLPFYFPRGTGTASGIAWPFLQLSADSNNLNLEFSVTVFNQGWTSAAGDFSVKYYLLQETAT